jgi:hypothetical protein
MQQTPTDWSYLIYGVIIVATVIILKMPKKK